MAAQILTQEELKQIVGYDPDTGLFTWKVKKGNSAIGKPAGCINCLGYIKIQIDKKQHLGHRLAWLYVYGEWPKNQIDHINHDRSDNRIKNIRDVTSIENHRNASILDCNTSGVTGVSLHRPSNKWIAKIRVKNKNIHIGCFKTLYAAAYARHVASIKHGYHANHGLIIKGNSK